MKALEHLGRGELASAALEMFAPYFRDTGRFRPEELAVPWIHAAATTAGNPHGAIIELHHELEGLGMEGQVPSRRTVNRGLCLPVSTNDPFRMVAETDIGALEDSLDRMLVDLANAVIRMHGWQGTDLYATIDGRSRPFYGRGSMHVRFEDWLHELSEAGRWSAAKFRNKNQSAVPLFAGTHRGHEWIHLTIHHRHLKVSLPISIRHRRGPLVTVVDRLLQSLDRVSVAPQAILFDKEFSRNHAILDSVRDYADRFGTWVVGPVERKPRVVRQLQQWWNNGTARHRPQADEPLWLHCEPDAKNRGRRPGYTVAVYTAGEMRADLQEETKPCTVYPGNASSPSIVAIAFYSSCPVGDRDVRWFVSLYARRWACESLFARHIMLMGRSQSSKMGTRHFGYVAGFVLLALYGASVALEHQDRATRHYTDGGSHRAFLARLRGGLKTRLAKQAARQEVMLHQ